MRILIDSREQTPYSLVDSEKATLKTGDYSVKGYEDRIAIERKAYSDLYSCLTSDKKRFRKQLERLGELEFSYLLVDSHVSAVLLGHPQCDLPGEKALKFLIRHCTEFGVPFCFVDSHGDKVVRNLLNEGLKRIEKESAPEGTVQIEDLQQVDGIGPKTIKRIEKLI